MATIKKEFKVSGKTLMSGEYCEVSVFPSEQEGIRFFHKDSKGVVDAVVDNVVSTQNCTVLANKNGQVRLVEHFMAVCGFYGIDSLDVCLNLQELPILDGSSLVWANAFKDVGFNMNEKTINIDKSFTYQQGDCAICVLPSDKPKVTYLVDFEHPDLKKKWVESDLINYNEILEARTFGYLKDLEKFQAMGLAMGASIDNTVGLTEDSYTVELRSQFEPIKHKILDLVGDFKLAGIDVPRFKANIIAKQAGHSSHVEMAKILKKELNL